MNNPRTMSATHELPNIYWLPITIIISISLIFTFVREIFLNCTNLLMDHFIVPLSFSIWLKFLYTQAFEILENQMYLGKCTNNFKIIIIDDLGDW